MFTIQCTVLIVSARSLRSVQRSFW